MNMVHDTSVAGKMARGCMLLMRWGEEGVCEGGRVYIAEEMGGGREGVWVAGTGEEGVWGRVYITKDWGEDGWVYG